MATRMSFAPGRAVALIDFGGGGRFEGVFAVERCEASIECDEIEVTRRGSMWREFIAGKARTRLKLDLLSDPGCEDEKLPQAKRLAYAVLFGDPEAVYPMIDAFLAEEGNIPTTEDAR